MIDSLLRLSRVAIPALIPLLPAVAQAPGEVVSDLDTVTLRDGTDLDLEIGTIYVPENRSDPDSRLIGVGFARIFATEQPPAAPPIFHLPGGPGSSFVSRIDGEDSAERRQSLAQFARFRHIADMVLVDQRGFSERGDVLMGAGTFPDRPSDRPVTSEWEVEQFTSFARQVVAQYEGGEVDLRGYTVTECAHDVADLSAALDYEQVMLLGTSFGSQWSFAIMRLFPDLVARAMLSGVEPLDHGYDMPSYVFAAVQRMWRSIDADPRFAPYLPEGGMGAAAEAVIERLERDPVALRDAGGTVRRVIGPYDFPWREPREILALYHEVLPPAGASGGGGGGTVRQPLIGILIDSSLSATPERRHRLWFDPATRYLSRRNFAMYMETADIWPSPDVGDALRMPIRSEIPVVFAQGDWDTSTPLENTFEIAPFFVNSRVLIAERGGHGVFGPIERQLPAVWRELEEFLTTGDLEGIPERVQLEPSRRFNPPSFEPPSGR